MNSLSTAQNAYRFTRTLPALALVGAAMLSVHCSSAPSSEETGASGTAEAMSSTVHSVYGMTTFGGPGDYQQVACGGNSRTINQWYVASSQRYGCNKHIKLTANGKCLVVYTADAGPATFVETRAGIAVLDSSPAVGRYFFNESGLGYSDLKSNPGKYNVHAAITTDPVGPCSGGGDTGGSSSGDTGGSSSGDTGGSSSGGSSSGGSSSSSSGGSTSSSGGGATCATDGDCNPGNDGSGLICTNHECVPGCHHDYNCPGNTTCVSGNCQ